MCVIGAAYRDMSNSQTLIVMEPNVHKALSKLSSILFSPGPLADNLITERLPIFIAHVLRD